MTLIDRATERDLIAIAPWLTCREDLDWRGEGDCEQPAELCIARWEDDGGRAIESRIGPDVALRDAVRSNNGEDLTVKFDACERDYA